MDLNALSKPQLLRAIKELIIVECDKEDDFSPEDIIDNEPLFGRKSRVALDSLDALQLSMVLKEKFAVSVEGSKGARKHLQSVSTIATFILAKKH